MAKPLVDDQLWELIEPLLPRPKPRRFRYPGRKRVDDRKALTGIVFVLKSGIPLGDVAPGDGLRFRHDVLASLEGME
jgi:transposase